jgi:copper transport protein
MRRLLAAVPAAAVVAIFLLFMGPAPADAHAGLTSSDPAAGATVPVAPRVVTLTFTEAPDPALSVVSILDAGGTEVQEGEPDASGNSLTQGVQVGLETGVYTVNWRVVSAIDGHATAGSFSFGVNAPAPAQPQAGSTSPQSTSGPTALSVIAKVLLYSGLMVLVAVAVVGLGLFHGRVGVRTLSIGGGLLAFVGAELLVLSTSETAGVSVSELLGSAAGRWLRVLLFLVAAILIAVLVALRVRWMLWVVAVAAAGAMLVRVLGGHAAAASPAWTAEALQWFHMLAAGTWVGGLVLLLALVRRRPDVPPVDEARRFSSFAVWAVGLVVATGFLRAMRELGGPSALGDLFSTAYGGVLAAKVGLVLVLLALGARNRYRSIGRLETDARPLRRIVRVELLTIVGVLTLTATLSGLAPPATTEASVPTGPPAKIDATGSDFATTTMVELEIAPGTPGLNEFLVLALRYGTEEPIPADQVSLRFASITRPSVTPTSIALEPNGDVWTGSGGPISLAGAWSVTAQIVSGSKTTEVPLVVTTRVDGRTQSRERVTDGPDIVTTRFEDETSLQTYIDPALAGTNAIHLTAFAPDGSELPLSEAAVVVVPGSGPPRLLTVTRLGPGHFAANADLEPGDTTVDVVATAEDGTILHATWSTQIAT